MRKLPNESTFMNALVFLSLRLIALFAILACSTGGASFPQIAGTDRKVCALLAG